MRAALLFNPRVSGFWTGLNWFVPSALLNVTRTTPDASQQLIWGVEPETTLTLVTDCKVQSYNIYSFSSN